MNTVDKNLTYIHNNTNRAYTIVACDNYRLKFNGVWYDAVLYKGINDTRLWSRTKTDFLEKFKIHVEL